MVGFLGRVGGVRWGREVGVLGAEGEPDRLVVQVDYVIVSEA